MNSSLGKQQTDKDWESLTTNEQIEWEERVRYFIEKGYISPNTDITEKASEMYEKSDV
jgi:hypothetical protein